MFFHFLTKKVENFLENFCIVEFNLFLYFLGENSQKFQLI